MRLAPYLAFANSTQTAAMAGVPGLTWKVTCSAGDEESAAETASLAAT